MKSKCRYATARLWVAMIFCAAWGGAGYAEELTGTVTLVRDKVAHVQLGSEWLPQIEDAVTISFDVPGVGLVPLQGTWKVAEVGVTVVVVHPEGEVTQPQKGQTVSIQCAKPQTRGEVDERSNAAFERGEDYYYGRHEIKQDYLQALKHYQRAAQLGRPAAQFSIGWLYDKGEGVKQDYVKARSWFLKAALQGHAGSQNSLGPQSPDESWQQILQRSWRATGLRPSRSVVPKISRTRICESPVKIGIHVR